VRRPGSGDSGQTMGEVLVDDLPPSAVHLCVDMQRFFSSGLPLTFPGSDQKYTVRGVTLQAFAMRSASRQLPYADRVVILLAVKFGCNISSDTERRIRTNERARVVDYLQALGISAISRHASYRRTATRRYAHALDLLVDVRLDERRLIVRELRREAKISFAHGLDSGDLDLAAKQLENWSSVRSAP
jgi:hypothetical protein